MTPVLTRGLNDKSEESDATDRPDALLNATVIAPFAEQQHESALALEIFALADGQLAQREGPAARAVCAWRVATKWILALSG